MDDEMRIKWFPVWHDTHTHYLELASCDISANDAGDEGRLRGLKNEERLTAEPQDPQPPWCVCDTGWLTTREHQRRAIGESEDSPGGSRLAGVDAQCVAKKTSTGQMCVGRKNIPERCNVVPMFSTRVYIHSPSLSPLARNWSTIEDHLYR